jgi:hypothetical protein
VDERREKIRAQQDRDEETRSWRRLPRAVEASAPRGLTVGDGDEALRSPRSGFVEEVAVRRVELVEAADVPIDALNVPGNVRESSCSQPG